MRFAALLLCSAVGCLSPVVAGNSAYRQTFPEIENHLDVGPLQLFDPAWGELDSVFIYMNAFTGFSYDLWQPLPADTYLWAEGEQYVHIGYDTPIAVPVRGGALAEENQMWVSVGMSGSVALRLTGNLDRFVGTEAVPIMLGYLNSGLGLPGDYYPSGHPWASGFIEYGYIAAYPVPEPASWLTMIAGFGLVRGAMRRTSAKLSVDCAPT